MAFLLSTLWMQWQLASDILQHMDTTADPCKDFYQFACGNYGKRLPLPEDKALLGPLIEMNEKLAQQLKNILEEPISSEDPKSSQLAKKYYQSCTNVSALDNLGLEPVKDIIAKNGGWPIVEGDKWNGEKFDWMSMNALMFREFGISSLIVFGMSTDFRNSSRRQLQIDQASLGLGKRDYYLEDNNTDVLEAYRQFFLSTALQLGANQKTAQKEVEDVIQFETALANISAREEDRRDFGTLYNTMSIAELRKQYPQLPFQKWIDHMNKTNWTIYDHEIVNVQGAPFLEQLPQILNQFSKRTIANYQLWTQISAMISYLAPNLRQNYLAYKKALSGVGVFKPRWQECVEEVSDTLQWPVGAMYARRYFSSNSKKEMEQLVANVREMMTSTIQHSDWMDEKTKNFAQQKMSQMLQKIGYPDDMYNETRLLRDLDGADIHQDQYLLNALSITRAQMNRAIFELYEAVNRSEWDTSPAIVNAFYALDKNEIDIPAGILQYPMYSYSSPQYVNYGRIGAIIGHEITHGFDDQGRQFDGEGNVAYWWTNDTLGKFHDGMKCFIDQYNRIKSPVTGQNLNGENTVGENIADNGGVKLAHKAYSLWRRAVYGVADTLVHKVDEPKLPGLANYTTDQLFFISYGQMWCNVIRPEYLRHYIITNEHSPWTYRVNVPLQNYEAFSNAFRCPFGSPMNPKQKCKIW